MGKKNYLCLTALFFALYASMSFAVPVVMKVYQRCGDQEFLVRNAKLYVANTKENFFVTSDNEGNFTLNDEHASESIMSCLANDEGTIFPGCRSDMTPVNAGKVVLHGLCSYKHCR